MRFAIVDKETHEIVHMYESDFQIKFGGPWGDLSMCCQHEVDESLSQYTQDQLEFREVNVQIGTERKIKLDAEENPIQEVAHDDEDNVILDENNNPVMLNIYETKPVYEKQWKIVKKIGV